MCFPKAPKPDPAIAAAQEAARQAEMARLAEEKKKQLAITKRAGGQTGVRSLISAEDQSGFGRPNYTNPTA